MKHKRKILALALTLCASLVCPVFASSYTVARGDCLWQIAKDLLGSGSRWTEIYEANRDTVKNPSMIQTGQVLVIPDGEAAPQTNPAIPAESAPPMSQRILRNRNRPKIPLSVINWRMPTHQSTWISLVSYRPTARLFGRRPTLPSRLWLPPCPVAASMWGLRFCLPRACTR